MWSFTRPALRVCARQRSAQATRTGPVYSQYGENINHSILKRHFTQTHNQQQHYNQYQYQYQYSSSSTRRTNTNRDNHFFNYKTQYRNAHRSSKKQKSPHYIWSHQLRKSRRIVLTVVVVTSLGTLSYFLVEPFRHFVIATNRCMRVGWAVALCIIDYKLLFRRTWPEGLEGKKQRHLDYEECHKKCAVRIRNVLMKNGGIYIKLGQHLAGVNLVPDAWSSTMRPLQDQCYPTPLDEVAQLFLDDTGRSLNDHFTEFNPEPIGVASLAQVHVATDRQTGQRVAVKLMHPDLEDFARIDMRTTSAMLKIVKKIFPTFEFTWLGEEMEQNLPLEMDFRHEAKNAIRCRHDFEPLKSTSLVIPNVLWARKRVMVMEYIDGARIDDLSYLLEHSIDRNSVAIELSRIFNQMLYINGFFHADPHHGNLLIRPAQPGSRSPYNFEIVLLDHGLYFDIDNKMRTNYARFWLSLLAPHSKKVEQERRHYARLVGNIEDEEHYAIFETALTGRANLSSKNDGNENNSFRAGSMMDVKQHSPEEAKMIRHAVLREGIFEGIFAVLRTLPRQLLMVIKLNDLTRSLDASLHTTHAPYRIWLVVTQYCVRAIWLDDWNNIATRFLNDGLSFSLMFDSVVKYWNYKTMITGIRVIEYWTDGLAIFTSWKLWCVGLWKGGFAKARQSYAGLSDFQDQRPQQDEKLNQIPLPSY